MRSSHLTYRLAALGAAVLFTVILNLNVLRAIGNERSLAAAEGLPTTDLTYYAALIREASEGHTTLGNVSISAYRDAPTTSSVAPLLQGTIMRLTGLSLWRVIALGDLLFPALIFLLVLGLARRFIRDSFILQLSATLFALGPIAVGLLRPISPQITLLALLLSLLLAVQPGRTLRGRFLGSIFLGLLIYLHVFYAAFVLAFEGLLLALDLVRRHSIKQILTSVAATFTVPCIALALKIFVPIGSVDPLTSADTFRRLGIIASHLPAAPDLQFLLIVTGLLIVATFMLRRAAAADRDSRVMLLCVVGAGLIVLNQSILHGVDVMFGLYYRQPLILLMRLIWIICLVRLIRPRLARIGVAVGLACIAIFNVIMTVNGPIRANAEQLKARLSPQILSVLSTLDALPGERIILAPPVIADLVPAYTRHTVGFSSFARYQMAPDAELAQRYLLSEALFPTQPDQVDRTYNLVFGLYAGNAAARERNLCVLKNFITRAGGECKTDLRAHIVHQELLPMLDHGTIDVVSAARQFSVDTVVADQPLPSSLRTFCSSIKKFDSYTVYDCKL